MYSVAYMHSFLLPIMYVSMSMYICRYSQLDDDQFESLLKGDKSYDELVGPSDRAAEDKQ